MKRKDYTLHALAVPLFIAILCNLPACYTAQKPEPAPARPAPAPYYNQINPAQFHTCNDKTHGTCDGECECDGYECPSLREYQIEIDQNGTYIYDGNRFVGYIPYTAAPALDTIFLQDNQ